MNLLKPVRPQKIADQVFDQLREMVLRGRLEPGDRLPSERALACQMGVSRPTVREAVGKLVNLGLVKQSQGRGTFVADRRGDDERNPLRALVMCQGVGLRELLEVRLGLECNSAMLAARRATAADISLLENSLAAMRDRLVRGEPGHQEDVHFHMHVAYASQNQAQVQLMGLFYDLLARSGHEGLTHLHGATGSMDLVQSQHENLLRAIKARDTQAAFESMRRHILFAIDQFDRA